jgi:hypothetical protein
MSYNLDNKQDFDRFMLDYYGKIYPTGRMTVYNTHPEDDGNGGTVMVANSDTSWTDAEMPILPALKTMMVNATTSLYDNNWKLYQHNYDPAGLPIQSVAIGASKEEIEKRLATVEREVAILNNK